MSKPWRITWLFIALTPLACSSPAAVSEPGVSASEDADPAWTQDQSIHTTSGSAARGGGNLMGGN